MLSEALRVLVKTMTDSFRPDDCDAMLSIVDSMPIVTCKEKKQRGKGCQGNNIQRILLDEKHLLLWNETSSGWPKEEKGLAFP